MEACVAVEKEINKVLSKFKDIDRQTANQLQECILQIQKIRQELIDCPGDTEIHASQALQLNSCVKKIKEVTQKLSSDHKDLHSSVSKVGKAVDRNFVSDFSAIVPDAGLLEADESVTQVNHVICEHFLRQGMLDIAETLVQDSGLQLEDEQKEPFLELHRILEALKRRDLGPALEWVSVNQGRLRAQHSALEFKLHRLQFIELVQQGPARQLDALHYAKHFEPFAHSHAKELQVLMGTLLYLQRGLQHSPYAHLLDNLHWLDIQDVFTRDACALLGLSVESPLSVVIKAGCAALPPLLNIKQVMQQRQCQGVWNAKDELPVEIDLGKECRFHSIFACPILRQQSTDANPPMRLVCGHVISHDALNKLANSNKVKCPYCPVEQSPTDARQILF